MVKRDNSPAAVQSVDRALLVLEILAGMGQAGVTEIAEEICVHKIDGVATDRGAGGTRIRRAGLRTRQVSTGFRGGTAGAGEQRPAGHGQGQPGRLRRAERRCR